ncbi:MAG: oxidoreductase, partial [Alphaproteobacteria bacterium]
VNLLGIDSVMQPYENRVEAWQNAAKWMELDNLDAMVTETNLEAVPEYARAILKGQVKGRVLVNPNA